MDQIDYKLVRLLSHDARTPFKVMADNLGISIDSVFRRYKKLEDEGVILGSTIVLGSVELGFKGYLGLLIKVHPSAANQGLTDRLVSAPYVYLFGTMWGDYDYFIGSYYQEVADVLQLINFLRSFPEILSIEIMIIETIPGIPPMDNEDKILDVLAEM